MSISGGRSKSIITALPSGFVLKVAGAALNFLAVPIALRLLGEQTYAAFTAILAFAGWLALGSSGIGNITAMNTAGHAEDQRLLRDEFWQAAISNFLGVFVVAILLFWPFHVFISSLAHDIADKDRAFLTLSAYYCFAALSLSAACVAFEGRYIGLLRSSYCNMVRLIGQLLALVALLVLVPLYPNMLSITIALTIGPLVSSFWFIASGTRDCPPPPHFHYKPRESVSLFLHGFAYLAVSLAVMFYGGGNLPLFAVVFGKTELATASVAAKTVQLYFSLTSIFVIPLAAALKQAIAAGDIGWARKALIGSAAAMTGASILGAIVMFFFGLPLIKLWTGVTLPEIADWIAPLSVMIVISGWYQFWIFVSFAFEGALPVAVCALLEVSTIALAYFLIGPHVSASASLWMTAIAMAFYTGTILPIRAVRFLRARRS